MVLPLLVGFALAPQEQVMALRQPNGAPVIYNGQQVYRATVAEAPTFSTLRQHKPPYLPQSRENWCWAAAVANLFAYYNHGVSQEELVTAIYGSPTNAKSGPPENIAKLMNRTWRGSDGKAFSSKLTSVFDAIAGFQTPWMSNALVLAEITSNRPLIVCTRVHVMLVLSIDYCQATRGSNGQPAILSLNVLDPWPASIAFTQLVGPDIVPITRGGNVAFLAACQVGT